MRLGEISNEKTFYETWSGDVEVFARVISWKWAPSQLLCKESGYVHSTTWLRDQPFEQGMIIYAYIHI